MYLIRIFLVVHGAVQGVGYRHLVSRVAERNGIRGIVRNASNGSVEILADAEPEQLEIFEKEIDVSMPHGPQVFRIERFLEKDPVFPKGIAKYKDFVVEKE